MPAIETIKQEIEICRWKFGFAEKFAVADVTGSIAYVITKGRTIESIFVAALGVVIAILLGTVIIKEYRKWEALIQQLGESEQ